MNSFILFPRSEVRVGFFLATLILATLWSSVCRADSILPQVVAGYYEAFEYQVLQKLVCNNHYSAALLVMDEMIARTQNQYWREFSGVDDSSAKKTKAILHANASYISGLQGNPEMGKVHLEAFHSTFPGKQASEFVVFSCADNQPK